MELTYAWQGQQNHGQATKFGIPYALRVGFVSSKDLMLERADVVEMCDECLEFCGR